jgi:hypothetical protein
MSTFSKGIQQTVYHNINDTNGTDIVIGDEPAAGSYKLFKFGYFTANANALVTMFVTLQVYDSLNGVWKDSFQIGAYGNNLPVGPAGLYKLVDSGNIAVSGYAEHPNSTGAVPAFMKLFPGMRVVKNVTINAGVLRTFCDEITFKSPNNGL